MSDRCRLLCAIVLPLSCLPARGGAQEAAAASAPPLTVRRAAEMALAQAPELAVARAGRSEARADVRQASDALRPEVFLTTNPGYASGLPAAVAGHLPSLVGVELRQSLYDADRRADRAEADARLALAGATYEEARVATARRALTLYARCWAQEAATASARRREDAARAERERTEARAAEGRATELDVERARLAEARVRQAVLDAESDRDLEQRALRRLIGWPLGQPLVLGEDPSAALPELVSTPVDAAPALSTELRALDDAAKKLSRSLELRKRWTPMVEMEAQYARLYHSPGYDKFYRAFEPDDWSIGVGVRFPLWSGGRRADAAARAQAGVERVEARKRAQALEEAARIDQAEAAAVRAQSRLSLERRAEGVAREDARVARALEIEGRLGPGEREAKDLALAEARATIARAEADVLVGRVEWSAARGELLAHLGLDAPEAQ
jgi:outer membrane protein TolC